MVNNIVANIFVLINGMVDPFQEVSKGTLSTDLEMLITIWAWVFFSSCIAMVNIFWHATHNMWMVTSK